MKKLRAKTCALLVCAALLLAGCGTAASPAGSGDAPGGEASPNVSGAAGGSAAAVSIDPDELFSNRDLEQSYDAASAVAVQLAGDTAACASAAVAVDGRRVTIREEGVYLITGTLTNGQIVVDAASEAKVQLVLSGASITSADSAAIYCKYADKVFITLAQGTENALANGGAFSAIDENNIDAVIFSKTDLTLNGPGSLTVTSPAGHGIVSKDELTVTGGVYTVTAAAHGFAGKDSVAVAGGSFTVTAGKDGFHAENSDDASLGFLYVADGSFVVDAQGDAISAGTDLRIDGGSWTVRTGDDGIHADGAVTIGSGSLSILCCYEGVEGQTVTINGGTLDIAAFDDGINAAGGADGSGTAFGFGKQDPFAADTACAVEINGGVVTIVSDGDCIDSNGSLTITGGMLDLTCSGNGNTALDAGGAYSWTGGDITTNDGSENGAGGRGGMDGGKVGKIPDGAGEMPGGMGGGKMQGTDPGGRRGTAP